MSRRWLYRVLGQVSWTAVDEALLGVANFAVTLILARWLKPPEFGGYMAASALFWIAAGGYGGLVPEPTMVFGAGRFRNRLASYFAAVATLHWAVAGLISVGLAGIGIGLALLGGRASGLSMLGYAAVAPLLLFFQLLRRTFYVRSVPWQAAEASTLYLLGTLAGIYAVYRSGYLDAFTAPLAAGAGSALAVCGVIARRHFSLRSGGARFVREVTVEHWKYGRWAVATGILVWIPGCVYFVVVPLWAGLEANAALGALRTLVLPALHLFTASTFLLIPAFSRLRSGEQSSSPVWAALSVLLACAAIYAVLVGMFGGPLMAVLYGGRYAMYVQYCWLTGLLALPTAAIAALGSALRACERPDRVLSAYVVSTIVTCLLGLPAVAVWGLPGALFGMASGYTATTLAMLWWFLRSDNPAEPAVIGERTA